MGKENPSEQNFKQCTWLFFLFLEGEVARDKGLHKFMVPGGLAAVKGNMVEKLMTRKPEKTSVNRENIYISI